MDDPRDDLPPIDRARAYLGDYRETGRPVLPSEQLRLAELVHAGLSPADAAETVQAESPVWSGHPDPADPDNFWIDDATGERVNAHTGNRTPG